MIFFKRLKWSAFAGLMGMMMFVSCEDEPTTLGAGLVGNKPFTTNLAEFEVFAFNKKIEAVQTNRLPIYQLGVFEDPLYGKTEARITSQVRLSATSPTFGDLSQAVEDNPSTTVAAQQLGEGMEMETVTEVFFHIPYLTEVAARRDADNDGVDDTLDAEPTNPSNDSDGDGVTNAAEKAIGTDPLDNTSFEVTETNPTNTFAKTFDLDSIYGNRDLDFNLKVERSTYYLRDFDPNTNFQQSQEYFSNQEYSPSFVSDVLFDGPVSITNKEMLVFNEDDPDTADVDESLTVASRIAPGIRVPLDIDFFQENLLDKEGGSELISQGNFTEFLRGIHLSLTPEAGQEMMMLLDLTRATITVSYDYQKRDLNGTSADLSDDFNVSASKDFVLNLITTAGGNAVNTYINEEYPAQIQEIMDNAQNSSRIYLKGGAGSFAEIRLFDADDDGLAEAINQIKANNWIINEANLVFYVDRTTLDNAGIAAISETAPSREPERLYLYNKETGFPLINFNTESTLVENSLYGTYLNYDGIVQKDAAGKADKYSVKITDHINNIIFRDSANVSLGLSMTVNANLIGTANAMLPNGNQERLPIAPTLTPVGTVLYGGVDGDVPNDKKLKLEIYYTEKN